MAAAGDETGKIRRDLARARIVLVHKGVPDSIVASFQAAALTRASPKQEGEEALMKALVKTAVAAALAAALAPAAFAQIISTSLPTAQTGAARDRFSAHIMATPFAKWDYKEV